MWHSKLYRINDRNGPHASTHTQELKCFFSKGIPNICVRSFCVEDWTSKEAGNLRCMLVHTLYLCKRSSTSRSAKVSFLKRFVMDLKLKGGGMV